MTSIQKSSYRALVIFAAVAIVLCAWYPPIQNLANSQVDAGFKRALISFASARTLNAPISVLQGTEVSFQPLGMGITLTLGQVLDPVNDLIEKFSSLMLVASVAFGIQKVLLAVAANWVISLLVCGVAVTWAVLQYLQKPSAMVSKVMLVLLMIRFAIPVVTIGSDFVFEQMLAKKYKTSQGSLDLAATELGQHSAQVETPKTEGTTAEKWWWEKLKNRATTGLPNLSISYDAIKKSVEHVTETVIELIVIFLLQTMIMPIILVWALYKVAFGVVLATRSQS